VEFSRDPIKGSVNFTRLIRVKYSERLLTRSAAVAGTGRLVCCSYCESQGEWSS